MTHIRHSEKVLIVKKLLLILILILGFQSWTKADDISDFEIEGMSIGDSLLDYVNIEYINNDKSYHGNNKKYYTILLEQDYQTFDAIQLTILDNDKNRECQNLMHLIQTKKDLEWLIFPKLVNKPANNW